MYSKEEIHDLYIEVMECVNLFRDAETEDLKVLAMNTLYRCLLRYEWARIHQEGLITFGWDTKRKFWEYRFLDRTYMFHKKNDTIVRIMDLTPMQWDACKLLFDIEEF
jgi:hypothetical protein